jgi:RsmE family RNA methyltransferase
VNLILLEASEVGSDGIVRVSDGRAAHLQNVLRVSAGQTVRVGLIDGPFGSATVTGLDDDGVGLRCVFDADPPPRPRVDLLLAVPRPKVLRRLWAQIAALGVGRVILTNAERVERPYFDTHFLDPAIYRPLLIEGLQQARDTRVPEVSIHRRFKPLVEDELEGLSGRALRLVAEPGGSKSVTESIRTPTSVQSVLLAIGPEGGWNAFELDLLAARGFERVSMGPRTLRTDTACLALLALAHDALPPLR